MPRAAASVYVRSARVKETPMKQYSSTEYEHHLNATFVPRKRDLTERIAIHRARLGLSDSKESDLLDD